ncbi:MAG: acyl-protein synthetase [Deltaproteobacteria bacterium]|nr:acyl-protein synthetase [Deltaproteobacteria bacterium]
MSDSEGRALWAAVERMIAAFVRRGSSGEDFEALTLRALRWQRAQCPALDRALAAVTLSSKPIETYGALVGLPVEVFASARIACFLPEQTQRTFLTSGTTGDVRGAHAFASLGLYEQGALAMGSRYLLTAPRYALVYLAEAPEANPHSSLSAMLEMFAARQALEFADESGALWGIREGALAAEVVREALVRACAGTRPVALLGASFAFVHLWDALGEGWRCALPAGSVVMPTGGFKGRSRVLAMSDFFDEITERFGVARADIVQEYGMTELSSQAYEAHREGVAPGRYVTPPWMRIEAVDLETLEVLPQGQQGLLRVVDLANLGSCVVLQTADLGVVHADGVEVLGRMRGAAPRGCARAVDAMLSEGRG